MPIAQTCNAAYRRKHPVNRHGDAIDIINKCKRLPNLPEQADAEYSVYSIYRLWLFGMRYSENSWTHPVVIAFRGQEIEVNQAKEAHSLLRKSWPSPNTNRHKAALLACAEAMSGSQADAAQAAFLLAALEAGILIRS